MNLKEDYIPYLSDMLSSIHFFPFHIKSFFLLETGVRLILNIFLKDGLFC